MSEETTIYLVRHAETAWNAEGRCQGRADAPFSAAGEAQLEQLAAELRDVAFDAAYTSPLARARATAATILAGRGLRAAQIPELAEIDYGVLQGTRFADWPAGLHEAWRANPWQITFEGGESLDDVRARVTPVLQRIVAAHPGETVLVSAHGHVNRILLLDLGVASGDFWSIEQANGSATRLAIAAEGVQ